MFTPNAAHFFVERCSPKGLFLLRETRLLVSLRIFLIFTPWAVVGCIQYKQYLFCIDHGVFEDSSWLPEEEGWDPVCRSALRQEDEEIRKDAGGGADFPQVANPGGWGAWLRENQVGGAPA